MERSVEQEDYPLDEPIGAAHGEEAVAVALSYSAVSARQSAQHQESKEVCGNPLREEPHPAVVVAVRRFGVVGLVVCALCTGVVRWWKSLTYGD